MLKSIIVAAALACVASVSHAQEGGPVAVIVRVFATPGRADELQALYVKRVEYLRKVEPDATFRVHRSIKDPNTFVWYEAYPSKAAYEHHVKVIMENFKKESGPTPAGIIAKPSESETLIEFGR